LVQFATVPEKIETILALDDSAVWGALGVLCGAKDSAVRELSTALRDRKLYKSIDVRGRLKQRLLDIPDWDEVDVENEVNRACAAIGEKIADASTAASDEPPRVLWDEAERQPYRELDESKGPLNQITIRTQGTKSAELVDLRERSAVVKAIETFRLNRAYVRENDFESDTFVQQLIQKGVEDAKR
jgi:hypothetical protein